jgi:basic amino acid/polyamine antiporter, APA family
MTTATLATATAPEGLQRQLGLGSATTAVAGEAIAVGIFLTPAGMAKALGSPFWILMTWLAMGAMTVSGALCYGELAGRFPRAGGSYAYLREAFGDRIAFLYGWMCLLVMDPGLTAALATGIAGYAAYIFHASPLVTELMAVAVIAALSTLNVLSMKLSAGFLRSLTWLKLGVLALLVAWAAVFRLGSWNNFVPFVAQRTGSLPLLPALGAALVGAFFSFGGWWDVTKIAGEVRDPGRTLPRALVLGVLVVTAVYTLVSAVFLYLIPLNQVTSDATFVAQAGEILFGRAGGTLLAAIVIVCVLGGLAAFMMAAPRVYYAMAADGLFLPAFARTHPRFGTPANAILLQGAIAAALVFLGNFQQILAYFMFAAIFFLGLTVAGLFMVRRRGQGAEAVILAAGYPWTPLVFLALVGVMLLLLGVRSPKEALLGCLVVLMGLPVQRFLGSNSPRVLS